MYFKEHLPILRRHDLCNLSHCLVTEIRVGKNASSRSRCQSCDKFNTFYSNSDLFLSNMNDLNPASLIVISDLNAGNSKWWSSDKQNFEGGGIHSSTTSAGYTQLTDQPTHIISNSFSCIDVVFASNPNVIYNSNVELSLFDKCYRNYVFGELNFMVPLPPTYKRQMWDYKKLMLNVFGVVFLVLTKTFSFKKIL